MKLLIYSDVHISKDSSIVKGFKGKYSTRLYYIIKSLNWAEKLADDLKCDYICNLGDTFDKPIINSIEATAIQDIKWSNLPHYVLVGNHDSDCASLEYSSVSVLKKLNFNIIDKPLVLVNDNYNLLLLPYIVEAERKSLKEYWEEYSNEPFDLNKKHIIFSHNDIAGCDFGRFISKEGFEIKDIESNCDLYLNGHLHNSTFITNKILNVGNLCGINFNEDSFKYKHGAWILDTDTLELKFYENPYSLNFYKILINKDKKLSDYKNLTNNPVLMIKCERNCLKELNQDLLNLDLVNYRILVYDEELKSNAEVEVKKLESLDYMQKFKDFIIQELGDTSLVRDELAEIGK